MKIDPGTDIMDGATVTFTSEQLEVLRAAVGSALHGNDIAWRRLSERHITVAVDLDAALQQWFDDKLQLCRVFMAPR